MSQFEHTPIAYDLKCPNCFHEDKSKYDLVISENGFATCPYCGKKYDLNNGVLTNGEGNNLSGLFRYRVTSMGPFGVLNIYN